MKFIIDYWKYITAFLIGIGGLIAFIKNIHQIKNLILQNKKLVQEKTQKGLSIDGKQKDDAVKKLEPLNNFNVNFSEIILKELDVLNVSREQLLLFLNDEFKSHPLLGSKSISYESTPVPLKNKTFVAVSKREGEIYFESISNEFPNLDIFNKWKEVCSLYVEAYRLPFRAEHLRLARESSFNYSFGKVQDLVLKLQEYIYSSRSLSVENENTHLHNLKNQACARLAKADFLYKEKYLHTDDTALLGQIAVELDLCISLVHKAILGYKIPQ